MIHEADSILLGFMLHRHAVKEPAIMARVNNSTYPVKNEHRRMFMKIQHVLNRHLLHVSKVNY